MFTDTIALLPFSGRTNEGRGFLPPILRATFHLMVLLECEADENNVVTDEERNNEIDAAITHWNARNMEAPISTASADRALSIAGALGQLQAEYAGWEERDRIRNLRDLVNRVLQFSADLDRELVGLRDSDPGTSL